MVVVEVGILTGWTFSRPLEYTSEAARIDSCKVNIFWGAQICKGALITFKHCCFMLHLGRSLLWIGGSHRVYFKGRAGNAFVTPTLPGIDHCRLTFPIFHSRLPLFSFAFAPSWKWPLCIRSPLTLT